ncbi:type I-C CRISPR-associated protein Cas7/Csd2 [Methylosinus sp. RM1]|uniref:type I-C CRISPR-associated protein Cas7/Csd2 n=1 Tax=Methylosinus sp. RM1 TaxID=2583817 RepID=UPI00140ACABD|nr:type I-C CRISPR-associated protein Cas7/Csd2 [Methylosinus sp. RM1]
MSAITHRYDFVYLFDVVNGNPNGDPDAGNRPRVDPDTSRGLVTDVCLKRKVRNFVALAKGNVPGFRIYMAEKAILNNSNLEAWTEQGIEPDKKGDYSRLPKDEENARRITRWMCENFFDIRAFGAVMSTDKNAGQVRGPIQLTFAESLDPVSPLEISITRSSVTNERDADKERTMGNKHIVPYGLYRAHGFISARLANDARKGTGFSEEDLSLFWRALGEMFDHDRSAARGEMTARRLIVFEHESDLGNAPAAKLFERVKVSRAPGSDGPPRSFSDYAVTLDEAPLPVGVKALDLI